MSALNAGDKVPGYTCKALSLLLVSLLFCGVSSLSGVEGVVVVGALPVIYRAARKIVHEPYEKVVERLVKEVKVI